jgi:hypothetical protein
LTGVSVGTGTGIGKRRRRILQVDFKSHYCGLSHCASILLQFDELSTFMKDILNHFLAALCDPKKAQGNFKLIRRGLAQSLAGSVA